MPSSLTPPQVADVPPDPAAEPASDAPPLSGDARTLSVLVLADPGLPAKRAHAVRERLESGLASAYHGPVEVEVETRLLMVDQASSLDRAAAARVAQHHPDADVVLMVTEMPRYVDGHPLVAGVFPDEGVAAVSLPTLGVWMSRGRVLRVLHNCVLRIVGARVEGDDPTMPESLRRLSSSRWHEREDGSQSLAAHSVFGTLRMVLGMVVSNEPWRTAPKLSTALATALGTGAFGIFYSSVWQMSDALSVARLIFTAMVAVTVMVLWLVIRNRLWDSPRSGRSPELTFLYNLSTGVTLTLCVLALYAVLTVVFLVAGLIVIAPSFLTAELGYPSDFTNYLKIAWFSAALGVVAGSLGTSFDDESEVRSVTHGQRERQRYASAAHIDRPGA